MHELTIQHIVDRVNVIEAITRLFVYTDQRDWPKVLSECFAPEVLFDMQSLTGTAPTLMAAEEIAAGWDAGLKPLAAVHHQVGNFLVRLNEDGADVFCYGIASHYLPHPAGQNTRVFVGSYDVHLRRLDDQWRIDRFKFTAKYMDGNVNFEQTAAG